jgi:16S rRNA (guanine527-N7)-methyltransferase
MSSLEQWKDKGLLTDETLLKLQLLSALIFEWNPKVNLTGYKTKEEIAEFLIGESVAALTALTVSGKSVLDFGSGAGIPGLVWAILEPSARITSVEGSCKGDWHQCGDSARSIS